MGIIRAKILTGIAKKTLAILKKCSEFIIKKFDFIMVFLKKRPRARVVLPCPNKEIFILTHL
ncbi:hypothetical protein HPHPH24B_0689 [Helicobacter pylori Hp H-24b]|nr:hypothetical protein HPHPH24B_0689 [Helicobacter pylori Hp H-24b]